MSSVTFAPYSLDLERRTLHRDGVEVALGGRSFDVLSTLATAGGGLVTKDELMARVWPGLIVEDNTIQVHISALRKLLGESADGRRYILTVTGQGYRFVAGPKEGRPTAAPAQDQPPVPPDKPSIAVLPFQNLGAGLEEEYFVDGVAEEIVMALSRVRWLFVIARNSSFIYKGRIADPRQVSRELGVRYLLDGSVRKSHGRIRIAGQLIDAITTQHLWSGRFEGDLSDIFDLQDKIASQVAGAVAPRLEEAEIQRARVKPTENPSAYDCYLRGLASFYREDRDGNAEALRFFLRAAEIDPDFASAYAMAARCYVQRKNDGWVKDAKQETAETARLCWRAAELGKDDAVALCAAALGLGSVVRDLDAASALIDRSLELNTNLGLAWSNSAWIRAWLGDSKQAIEHAARAMRLSPVDPRRYTMDAAMANAYFVAGQYDDAIVWGEKAAREKPRYLPGLRVLAASYALGQRQTEARSVMAEIRRLAPDMRCSQFDDYLPHRLPADKERYIAGLRLAGLPE